MLQKPVIVLEKVDMFDLMAHSLKLSTILFQLERLPSEARKEATSAISELKAAMQGYENTINRILVDNGLSSRTRLEVQEGEG